MRPFYLLFCHFWFIVVSCCEDGRKECDHYTNNKDCTHLCMPPFEKQSIINVKHENFVMKTIPKECDLAFLRHDIRVIYSKKIPRIYRANFQFIIAHKN